MKLTAQKVFVKDQTAASVAVKLYVASVNVVSSSVVVVVF